MKTRFIESGIGFGSDSMIATNPNPIKTTKTALNDVIADIVQKESGGRYDAVPRRKDGSLASSAAGKYQFLWDTWGKDISKFTGVNSKQEFLNNPKAQDDFFNNYYVPNKLMPAVGRIKKYAKAGIDEGALTKLVHFRGEKGAKDYLTGKLSDTPEGKNNMAISKYTGIPKMRYGGIPPKMNLGGVISTFGALIQPVAQAIEGDGTNIGRSMISGGLQSGVVGAAMKGFQAYQANKLQKEQARKQGGIDMQNVEDNSSNTYKQLALNPVGYYAQGGAVEGQYEAEKGEVALGDAQFEQAKELAPGIQEIGGKSHEEGGTMGQGGNFIFSNKLFLNPLDVQLLKTVNINADEKTPYSDAVKKLANITKKYSVASNRYRTSNTNKAMLGRVNMILQGLAENQEQVKQQ